MTNPKIITIAALVMSGLIILPGTNPGAQDVDTDTCARRERTYTLMINETNNVPTGVRFGNVRIDNLYVCPGDTVAWILQGRGFTIDFTGATPFGNNRYHAAATAGRISAVVRPDVTRGASFKYDIGINGGGVLDPRIIVQD